MIDEVEPANSALCKCERPLRSDETLCPHCERSDLAWWKVPTKMAAGAVGTAVVTVAGVAAMGLVSALVGGKPRA